MIIALFFVAVARFTPLQDVPTAVFTEPFCGFQFNYPKTWSVVKSNKRKDRDRTTLVIPIEGTEDKAELDVDRTDFHASTDLWQTIQLRANEQLHRQVVRQWTQEVLGVSMLFSRIDYTERGVQKSAVVGLFYTRTSEKLMLRLTSPTEDFDKVFYTFGKMLETLRQTDGKLPEEDNPNIELAPVSKKPELAPIMAHAIDASSKNNKTVVKAPVTVDIVVSTRKVTFRVPEGWTAENVKGNEFDLKQENLTVPLHLQFFSVLDSAPPMQALTKLSAHELSSFNTVDSREDSNPIANKAGCTVATVWRFGKGSNGEIITSEAMGSMGDYYFLSTYHQTDKVQSKADRKLIDALLKLVSIEPAQ